MNRFIAVSFSFSFFSFRVCVAVFSHSIRQSGPSICQFETISNLSMVRYFFSAYFSNFPKKILYFLRPVCFLDVFVENPDSLIFVLSSYRVLFPIFSCQPCHELHSSFTHFLSFSNSTVQYGM